MAEKQETIINVLKKRIAQLEESEALFLATQQEKDDLVKEIEDLRSEAHEAIRQWENKTMDLRNELTCKNTTISKYTALLKETENAKKEMEAKIEELEALCSNYSLSMASLEQQLNELKQSESSLRDEQIKIQREWMQMSEHVKQSDKTIEDLKNEVKRLSESERVWSEEKQKLQIALSNTDKQNGLLEAENNRIALQVEKLTSRINELKNINEQTFQESEMTHQRYTALQSEFLGLKSLLEEKKSLLSKLGSENAGLELSNQDLTTKLNNSLKRIESLEMLSQQQLDIISAYEKDIDEFKDTCIAHRHVIDELRNKSLKLEDELTDAMRSRNELETQLEVVKQSHSELVEISNEAKRKSEATIIELKAKLDTLQKESSERILHAEGKFEFTLRTVQELVTSVYHSKIREFFVTEQEQRQRVELAYHGQIQLVKNEFAKKILAELRNSKKQIDKLGLALSDISSEKEQLLRSNHALTEQLSATDHALCRQCDICTNLEQELSEAKGMLQTFQSRNASLGEDNTWLKGQVEAMRQELVGLDELFNTSLNEMREDNERLQQENRVAQDSLKRLKEERARVDEKADYAYKQLNMLRDELATLTRTLNLKEAELKSTNLQLERSSNTLSEMKCRLEAQEKTKNDLLSSNSALLSKLNSLKEQFVAAESSQKLALTEKQNKIDGLKTKLVELTRQCQHYQSNLEEERKKHLETHASLKELRKSIDRMRNPSDGLKERCRSDADSIKDLTAERDNLLREKDSIVEKYNKLYEAYVKVQNELRLKNSQELDKLIKLGSDQEKELQALRNQNVILKKSVSMFVKRSTKSDNVLIEKLNLSEGRLRYPKKLSVARESK